MRAVSENRSRSFRLVSGMLVVPGAIYLLAFYVVPILATLRLSLGSEAAMSSFVGITLATSTWVVFKQTFEMAVIVTAISLLLAYPIAFLMVSTTPRRRQILLLLVLLPYWISTLVRSYAWISILSQKGVINWVALSLGFVHEPLDILYNRFGAVVGMVNVVLPVMTFVLFSAFSRIDRRLLDIGGILGGRPLFVFGRVWLPLSASGVASGCILVFLISLGVFTTPAILGGAGETSVAIAIEQQVNTLLDLPAAAALSTMLLVITFGILALTRKLWVPALLGTSSTLRHRARRNMTAILFDQIALGTARMRSMTGSARPGQAPQWQSRSPWRIIIWSVCALIFAYLLAPVFVVISLSFSSASYLQFPPDSFSWRWFEVFFKTEAWTSATQRSMIVALIATAGAVVLGLATAYGIEQRTGKQKDWLFVVFLSPLVMPPTILAFGLYYLYAQLRWLGSLPALAAAHIVLILPFMLVALSQGIRSIDPLLAKVSGSLGARPAYTFRRVTLPLLRTAIISGSLLAFLTSFDELVVALFLTGPTSATLPKQMWDSVRFEVDPTNAAAATLLIVMSILFLGVSVLIDAGRQYGSRKKFKENAGG